MLDRHQTSLLDAAASEGRLTLLFDFDGTMTTSDSVNSMNAMARFLGPGNAFSRERDLLYHRYKAYHREGAEPVARAPKLQEWWEGQMELYLTHQVREDLFAEAVRALPFRLRPEVSALIGSGLPSCIVSAGSGNVIEAVLEREGLQSEGITVLSNFVEYESGRPCGFTPVVHPLNKGEVWMAHSPRLAGGSFVLALGNAPEDDFLEGGEGSSLYLDVNADQVALQDFVTRYFPM